MKPYIVKWLKKWLLINVIFNVTLFIVGSAMWFITAHTRTPDPEHDAGGPKTGPYLESRTYQQAAKDAYWPFVNGVFAPDFDWNLTMGMITSFAVFSLGGTALSAYKRYKKESKASDAEIDLRT